MPNKTRFPPILHQGRSQCEGRGQTPGGTQLLFGIGVLPEGPQMGA